MDQQSMMLVSCSFIRLGNFIYGRDAAAVLLMYKTGIRINTLVQLENGISTSIAKC
ncbi:hypothetical protein [Bacillus sp. ISL-4]|uniref:hypothetical protein n=1 Tax=Bacillus sp. ISL-4 TaxID=2819125 RepID=UPI0025712124|nr:hypothetical protein [Bacillus sp. ISL-4]